MAKATYSSSGVDLDLYETSMARLPKLMHRTFSPRVMQLDGGFAGLFQLDFNSHLFARKYEHPVLVSCTDGVGTKLKVAQMANRHQTVGIDLVAMSINDAICCGAEPLFFLDYVAMSHDDPDRLEEIVAGVSNGCIEADCALLGGETAIMPDLYQRGDYDLAGFCVGVVERKNVITGQTIVAGDVVLGIASSGLHSNGYSLARKVVFEIAGLTHDANVPQLGRTVADELLQPTRIYARVVRQVLRHYTIKNVVHGIAHVTGGGLHENLQRIVPANVDVEIQWGSWNVPSVFAWLQSLGEIEDQEMHRVFNMGVGLVLVLNPYFANSVQRMVEQAGFECPQIGRVISGTGRVVWQNPN